MKAWVDGTVRDLRLGLRNLGRAPGFTAAAAVTLALGMGAATAIFTVVNAVLLRPLPFPEPERLVSIRSRWLAESGYEWDRYPVGSPEYFDYLAQNRTMAAVGAVSTVRLSYRPDGGDARMVTGGLVSPSLFPTLGVAPLLGRALVEEDGGPRPAAVVVLSHGFWLREMGGDSAVVGRSLSLGWETQGNQETSVVVGVMPPGFTFPDPDVELWAPLLLDPARTWRGGHWFAMVARLAPGVRFEEAETEMAGMMARWRDVHPDHHRGHFLYVTPLLDDLVADVRPTLLLLFGAVGLLLLIACANVASLVLARGSYRSREVAVRAALGAGRGQILRQLLAEGLVLSVAGGALGALLATLGVEGLLALDAGSLPRGESVSLDARVLAFAGLVVVGTTLVFGALPGRQAAAAGTARALSLGGRATAGREGLRLRGSLVIAEVAMALLLVVGAGLMAKSYWRTVSRDPGFDPHGLLAVGIVLPQAGYTPEEKVDLVTRLARRVEGLPGVDGTGIASRPPYLLDNSQTRFSIEGRGDVLPGEEGPTGSHMMADAALLRMLGVRVVSGRLFDGTDVADGPPVALVDETLARRYWPGEDAVGRRIRFGATDSEFRTIVGVVSAVRFDGPTVEAPTFFENPDQATRFAPFHLGSLTLMVRTEGDPLALAGPVRDALRGLDPSVPVSYVSTLEALRSQAVAGPRFTLVLLGAFALAALLLGAVGIAGVMAQAVAQRTREIGVRRALGATAGAVERLVLTRGLRLAGAGMGVGLLGALALNRILEGFLFEVSTVDAGTYALVTLVVAVAAGLATAVPARRATRIDPVEALRGE